MVGGRSRKLQKTVVQKRFSEFIVLVGKGEFNQGPFLRIEKNQAATGVEL